MAKIVQGGTEPGVGWKAGAGGHGIMIDVDTGLGANTGYTCSLAGSRWHYGVKGASETYIQEGWGYKGGKDGGFRLYLTWAEGVADGAPTVKEAENYGWYVNWIGRG